MQGGSAHVADEERVAGEHGHIPTLAAEHDAQGVGRMARCIQRPKYELAARKGIALAKGRVGVLSPQQPAHGDGGAGSPRDFEVAAHKGGVPVRFGKLHRLRVLVHALDHRYYLARLGLVENAE